MKRIWWLKRDIHISWYIAVWCCGVLMGAALSPVFGYDFGLWIWLLTAGAVTLYGAFRQKRRHIMVAACAGLLMGLWRGDVAAQALSGYNNLYGQTLTVSGSVVEDIEQGKRGDMVLRLRDVSVGTDRLPGKLWVSTTDARMREARRSDRVELKGKINEGFGSFAGSMYRAQVVRIQRAVPGDWAIGVRDWFGEAVRGVVSEPQASLGMGFLTGQQSTLPDDLTAALRVAGLTHIVVASGYNLTILVRLSRRLFVRYSKFLALVASGGLAMAMMTVTGMSPSMTRAGLVTGLSLAAWYYGRRFHPLVLLSVAAAVTVLFDPQYVWGDMGWQLSFAAFAGVVLIAPITQKYFYGDAKPGTVRQIAGETIAAFVATLPIIAIAFGEVSVVAVAANILVVPMVPLAMLLVFLTGSVAALLPLTVSVVGLPAEIVLTYVTQITYAIAGIPWAQWPVTMNAWTVMGYYAALAVLLLYMARASDWRGHDTSVVE